MSQNVESEISKIDNFLKQLGGGGGQASSSSSFVVLVPFHFDVHVYILRIS